MSVYSGDRAQAPVVVWAYWVAVLPEVGRVRRAQGVQIDDGDPVTAPGRGEVAAAPDRWIVERGISGARIEHQENRCAFVGQAVARASQKVTVLAAFADDGAHGVTRLNSTTQTQGLDSQLPPVERQR